MAQERRGEEESRCTYTHGGDEDLLLGAAGLAQDGADLAGAGGAEGVAEGDGAAAGVDLGVVQAQDVEAVDGHGGKGLVDLKDVDVFLGQLELAEELRDRRRRADAHDARRHARDRGAAEFRQDRLPQLDGFGALH